MQILFMFLGVMGFVHFGAGCDGASGGDTTAAIDGEVITSEFVIEFVVLFPVIVSGMMP